MIIELAMTRSIRTIKHSKTSSKKEKSVFNWNICCLIKGDGISVLIRSQVVCLFVFYGIFYCVYD